MLVKIGDTVYDPNEQPISIYLTDQDKQNVANMHPDSHYQTTFPSDIESESLDQWIDEFKNFVTEYELTHPSRRYVMSKGKYSEPEQPSES